MIDLSNEVGPNLSQNIATDFRNNVTEDLLGFDQQWIYASTDYLTTVYEVLQITRPQLNRRDWLWIRLEWEKLLLPPVSILQPCQRMEVLLHSDSVVQHPRRRQVVTVSFKIAYGEMGDEAESEWASWRWAVRGSLVGSAAAELNWTDWNAGKPNFDVSFEDLWFFRSVEINRPIAPSSFGWLQMVPYKSIFGNYI